MAILAGLGYLTGSTVLTAFQSDWKTMSPLTAMGILAVGMPLTRRRRWAGTAVLAISVCTMAAAVFASHALYHGDVLSAGLNRLLGIAPALGGRTSVATSLCLLLLGGATFASRRGALTAVELMANATLLVAGSALLGYAYNISDLYSYYIFNSMALPTALALACLAVALLLSEPESRLGMAVRNPHAGGKRIRHILALTALPSVLGWILLHTRTMTVGGDGFAMAILAICTSVPSFYLLLEYARTTELLQRTRDTQAHAQQAQAVLLQDQVSAITAQLALTHQREVTSLAQLERAKRSEVIAQLTGSIAHDFNNLLMVIGGSAQLMKLQIPAGHVLMRHADKISATVTTIAKLTAQLAAFSRTQRLEAQPVPVDDVVRTAVLEFLETLPSHIRLVHHLDAADAWVLGDRAQLQLAVGHLLRNAGDAMDKLGILNISTSITPSDSREGNDTIKIRVQDDGCGMPPEVLANAVEPFFTTKSGSQHQGLGLAQAISVVHQASGTLSLSSTPGRGSCVDICLPRHAMVAKQARPVASPGSDTNAGNRRLLVIDDDSEVRTVIVELLRTMNYEVTEAHDGETGLRKLEQVQPALAIIDYLMPGMNGGEVASKARQRYPALPILFISGYADSAAIAAIPRAQLLRKPILPTELEQAVICALGTA